MNRLPSRRGPLTRRGFTLVELALALVILGVLLSLTLPSYQNYRERLAAFLRAHDR